MQKTLFRKKSTADDGFSLMEISIVLVVIGLLATFILKGQDLVESVRLRAVLSQVDQFRSATHLFMERYDALPGDFGVAKEMISQDLDNGRQDGAFTSPEDSKRFWKHLVSSGIISVNMTGDLPSGKIGGVFEVSSNIPGHPGTWFVLTGVAGRKIGVATPAQAATIDKKGDDGNPMTGNIQALNGDDAQDTCVVSEKYNIANKQKGCVLLFKIL